MKVDFYGCQEHFPDDLESINNNPVLIGNYIDSKVILDLFEPDWVNTQIQWKRAELNNDLLMLTFVIIYDKEKELKLALEANESYIELTKIMNNPRTVKCELCLKKI